jgi:hypothetical protein
MNCGRSSAHFFGSNTNAPAGQWLYTKLVTSLCLEPLLAEKGTARMADMCRNGLALIRPAICPWFRIRFCRKNTNISDEAGFCAVLGSGAHIFYEGR